MMTDSDIADEAGRLVFMAKRLAKYVSCEKKLSFLEHPIAKFTYFKSKCGLSNGLAIAHKKYISGFLTELDLEEGVELCAAVERTIDVNAALFATGESRLFHYKLHELCFACGVFGTELREKLCEKRMGTKVKGFSVGILTQPRYSVVDWDALYAHIKATDSCGLSNPSQETAKPAEPTQQSEPTTDGCGFFASTYCSSAEPTQQPEPTKPAEPTQQPESIRVGRTEPTQPPEPPMVTVFVDQRSRLLEEEWAAAKAARQHALVASTAASIKDATNDLLIAIAQLGRAK